MKKSTFTVLFLIALAASWTPGIFPGNPLGPIELSAATEQPDRVVVYQFHRRFRCEACYKLESAMDETFKTHFPDQFAEGKLVFNVIDLDSEGNKQYEKKYDFFYNTVIVVDVRASKEVRFKNIEKVWQLTEDKDQLIKFIKTEVDEYMNGL